jgi:hypothetical protein
VNGLAAILDHRSPESCMPERLPNGSAVADQAAGLRRLFVQRTARLCR